MAKLLLVLLASLLLSWLLIGCSTSSPPAMPEHAAPAGDDSPQAFAALMGPAELLSGRLEEREAVASVAPAGPQQRAGHTCNPFSSNVTKDLDQHEATLDAGAEGLSWAVYTITSVQDIPGTAGGYLSFFLNTSEATTIWVGVSNFDKLAWDWYPMAVPAGPSDVGRVELPAGVEHGLTDFEGTSILVALVLTDSAVCRVNMLNWWVNQKDIDMSAVAGSYRLDGTIRIDWAPLEGVSYYQLEVSTEGQGGASANFQLPAEQSNFVHSAQTVPGLPPQQGGTYEYRLYAVFEDGLISRPSSTTVPVG